jgi:ribonucleoside-diphosphate reductase alpha chain
LCSITKYIDQGISVNTSYNPQHFEDEKIPMSLLLQHIVMFYKYGGKQLYYNNTYDGQGEVDVEKLSSSVSQTEVFDSTSGGDDDCDSCKI